MSVAINRHSTHRTAQQRDGFADVTTNCRSSRTIQTRLHIQVTKGALQIGSWECGDEPKYRGEWFRREAASRS